MRDGIGITSGVLVLFFSLEFGEREGGISGLMNDGREGEN